MILEEGKRYVVGTGEVTDPLVSSVFGEFKGGTVGGFVSFFKPNGKCSFFITPEFNEESSHLDIVAEYVELN